MLKILNANNLRLLVKQANELGLKKEDIITVQNLQSQLYMVYEK